eukprot:7394005-Lingulodinium_polyedra.AAC.1
MVYSNAVRRERVSGPDLWEMMKGPATEAEYNRVITTDMCLTLSKGLVRLTRRVGPTKRRVG